MDIAGSVLSIENYEEPPSLPTTTTDPELQAASAVPSLAERIGNTKVYLLSDSIIASKLGKSLNGKRKHEVEDVDEEGEGEEVVDDVDMDDDPTLRQNALLLQGSPISNLPTSNIFAYSSHFDAHPIGLEWIDDHTCVLVFDSKAIATAAHRRLLKAVKEDDDVDGFVTAKSIPVALWPPELRINDSLGKGEGLRGVIKMRWARKDDVKEKGARNKSKFYKKHGSMAGKSESTEPLKKRRRRDGESDEAVKAQLDNDLDTFLAGDGVLEDPPSPPSKMRSANMDANGRSLLDRTAVIRPNRPLPRRVRDGERSGRRVRNQAKSTNRVQKSQEELDAELDAIRKENK